MIEILRRMLRSPQGLLGLVIVGLIMLVVVVGPAFAPHDPEKMAPLMRYKPPTAQFWLGTDQYGRDILSRLLHGARATVLLAVLATALGTLVGAVIGTVSAFLGGRSDEAIMRTVDAIMSIPSLLLALLIVNLLGKSSLNALFAIALAFAPGMARVTRSVALSVRKQDYVNAAIARGESAAFIVGREMLPNVIAPIIVEMTIRVAFAVMLFATLSFLGLGAQPPTAELGSMAADGRKFLTIAPHVSTLPCAAIFLVVLAFNILGDALRDAMDPKLRQ